MNDNAAQKFEMRVREYAEATRLDENTGIFPLDSEWRRLAFQYSTLFGAPRSLLLQIAHPIVAQGVRDFSEYDTNPAKRAVRTFFGVWAVTLGRQSFAVQVAKRVFRAHMPIKGVIPGYAPGMADRKYSAMDPRANLWVWATLVEGVIYGHRAVKHRVSRARLERMYQESKLFGLFFNVKADLIPETLDDFEAYFQRVIDEELEVTPAGKAVGNALISGARFPFTMFGWLFRTGAVENLPDSVVEAYGWARTRFTRTLHATLLGSMRFLYAVLPEGLMRGLIGGYPNLRHAFFGPGTPPPALPAPAPETPVAPEALEGNLDAPRP